MYWSIPPLPKPSALIHSVRLCRLKLALPRFGQPAFRWKARAPRGNLKRLNRVRKATMAELHHAPMDQAWGLMKRGFRDDRMKRWKDNNELFRQLGRHAY